jgi:hypothetical protein
MTPINERKRVKPYASATILAVVILAGILLTVGLVRLADNFAPQIGDIISFPATQMPSNSTASITARPTISGSRSCILDVRVIQRFGGSLVVEAVRLEPERAVEVHWAGVRTDDGPGDCGGSIDLLLNSAQIAALTFAAGGTGVKAQNQR